MVSPDPGVLVFVYLDDDSVEPEPDPFYVTRTTIVRVAPSKHRWVRNFDEVPHHYVTEVPIEAVPNHVSVLLPKHFEERRPVRVCSWQHELEWLRAQHVAAHPSRVPTEWERLKALRLAKHLTQAELANILNCSVSAIGRMEGASPHPRDVWKRALGWLKNNGG